MEMSRLGGSRHGNGNVHSANTNCSHSHAKQIFNQYISRLDTDTTNPQVQHQVAELQSLLRQIKTKQKKKIEKLDHQIDKETTEIQKLKERLQAVSKTKEKPGTDDVVRFKNKYILFCTSERKELCRLLKSAEKPRFILSECYSYCERKHKNCKDRMVKEHLISPRTNDTDIVANLQKMFAADTSKYLLQEITDEKQTNEPVCKVYDELRNNHRDFKIDGFFEKSLEICWTMVSNSNPMKFCSDKYIRKDCAPKPSMELNSGTKNPASLKSRGNSVKKPNADNDNLELKYPAVLQGNTVIVKGLKQEKVF